MGCKHLYRIVISLDKVRSCYFSNSKGIYPPKLNTCKNQTNASMIYEINRFIKYLKKPDYNYLVRDKS